MALRNPAAAADPVALRLDALRIDRQGRLRQANRLFRLNTAELVLAEMPETLKLAEINALE
jgi:hypothetical protein